MLRISARRQPRQRQIPYVFQRRTGYSLSPGARVQDRSDDADIQTLVPVRIIYPLLLTICLLVVCGSGERMAVAPVGVAAAQEASTRGVRLLQQGRAREALALLQQAAESDPTNPKIHYNVGVAHARLRQFASAIEAFGRAVELAPQQPDAHFALAVVMEIEHRQAAAAAHFVRAAVLAPERAEYHFRLGKVRRTIGQVEKALAALEKAVELDSTHLAAHYLRADLLAASNRPEEAAAGYRRALKLDSQRADVLLGLGQAYAQQGKHSLAVDALVGAVELEPRNSSALYLLSQAYLEIGLAAEREEALEAFRRLSRAQWLFKQGDLYARRGALDAASAALEEALILDPDHAEARERLSQLGAEQ